MSACGRGAPGPFEAGVRGRYAGVGIYPPGAGWTQMAHAAQPSDPMGSRLSDDDQIIVVVDSKTGDIRQCGNLSGVCIAMNPWTEAAGSIQTAPVLLTKHVDQSAPAQTDSSAPPAAH